MKFHIHILTDGKNIEGIKNLLLSIKDLACDRITINFSKSKQCDSQMLRILGHRYDIQSNHIYKFSTHKSRKIHNFSTVRNMMLHQDSSADWIMFLDDDDILPEKTVEWINNNLKTIPEDMYAIGMCYTGIMLDSRTDGISEYHYPVVRLFRGNKGLKFIGSCHESIVQDIIDKNKLIQGFTNSYIKHKGYELNRQNTIMKILRNFNIITSNFLLEEQDENNYSVNLFKFLTKFYKKKKFEHDNNMWHDFYQLARTILNLVEYTNNLWLPYVVHKFSANGLNENNILNYLLNNSKNMMDVVAQSCPMDTYKKEAIHCLKNCYYDLVLPNGKKI